MNSGITALKNNQTKRASGPLARRQDVELHFQDRHGRTTAPRALAGGQFVISGHREEGQTLTIMVSPKTKRDETISCAGCNVEYLDPKGCPWHGEAMQTRNTPRPGLARLAARTVTRVTEALRRHRPTETVAGSRQPAGPAVG